MSDDTPNRPPAARRRAGLSLQVPAVRLPRDYGRVDELRRLAREGVAGFLVFGGDRELLPPFLASLEEAAGRPLLFMSDVERGVGQQVRGCLDLPPLMAVGATLSEERAYEHGRATAIEARALGINVVLGPVVDVLTEPANPIVGNRSFGANPRMVAKLGAAWIAGAQDQGVLACAKHFPGHGDTSEDSHDALPEVDAPRELLEQRELLPFRAAVDAGVGAVMTAHVAFPALDPRPRLPASLSRPTLVGVLREEMGFGGLVVSDALVMSGLLLAGSEGETLEEPEAAVRCVEAGCDLLLHPVDPFAVAHALEAAQAEGRIDLGGATARVSMAAADLRVEPFGDLRPGNLRRGPELEPDHVYDAYGMARDSVAVITDSARRLPLERRRGEAWLALILDDDDEPRRAERFHERAADFEAGVLRLTDWPKGAQEETEAAQDPEAEALLKRIDAADGIVLALACDQRAWKGRPGLRPGLAGLADTVLRRARNRTTTLLMSAPGVLAGLSETPATVVSCWGDAPVSVRAALDALLAGQPMRGLDPSP